MRHFVITYCTEDKSPGDYHGYVPSETTAGAFYRVDYDAKTGAKHCSCRSFRYDSGLDDRGFCKHLRSVVRTGCTFDGGIVKGGRGISNGVQARSDRPCPSCGSTLMYRYVSF